MRARRAAIGLAAALTACGSPAVTSSPTPASSPSPVPGTAVVTAAFTTVVPPGWTDETHDPTADAAATAAMPGGTPLLVVVAVNAAPTGSAEPTIDGTVGVVELAFPVSADQLVPALTAGLDPAATNVSVAKPVDVGGITGEAVTYDHDVGGAPAETEEVLVSNAGHTDDIRFTAALASYGAERSGLVDILSAWEWPG